MSKKRLDSKAITEAYEILMLLDEENLEKIPERILAGFKEKKDNNYQIDIQKLMDGEILQDTKDILCAMYYKYLANDKERQVIDEYKQSLENELNNEDQALKVGMGEDFFAINNKEIKYNLMCDEKELQEKNAFLQVKVSDNIFTKILDKIKRIFKK